MLVKGKYNRTTRQTTMYNFIHHAITSNNGTKEKEIVPLKPGTIKGTFLAVCWSGTLMCVLTLGQEGKT